MFWTHSANGQPLNFWWLHIEYEQENWNFYFMVFGWVLRFEIISKIAFWRGFFSISSLFFFVSAVSLSQLIVVSSWALRVPNPKDPEAREVNGSILSLRVVNVPLMFPISEGQRVKRQEDSDPWVWNNFRNGRIPLRGTLNGHKRGTSYLAIDDKVKRQWNWEPTVIHTALMLKLMKLCWLDLPRVFWCDRMLRLGPYPPPLIEISDPEENQRKQLAGRVSGMRWGGFTTCLN